MIISTAQNFVFIHNPKAAGTAYRSVIRQYHDHPVFFWGIRHSTYFGRSMDYAHIRLWEMPAVAPHAFRQVRDLPSLVFLRDPVRRFISAIFEHYRQYRRDVNLSNLPADAQHREVIAFVQNELSLARVVNDHRFVHFTPQYWFTHLGQEQIVKHLLPIGQSDLFAESFALLGLPAEAVPVSNESRGLLKEGPAAQFIESFVSVFYATDYKLFGELFAAHQRRPLQVSADDAEPFAHTG